MKDIYNVFLQMTFILFTDLIILKKKKEIARLLTHPITRQCYYCDKYFTWHKGGFYDRVKTCSDIAGIVYKFENQKVVSFQNNFKYMGDLPLTIYFDFQTISGNSIGHNTKMVLKS